MPGSRSNHYAAYTEPSQAEAEAGTSLKKRVWSALRVKQAIAALATSGLDNISEDLTPQLGGDLDVNGQSIVSASGGDIPITPDTTGDVILDGVKWPQADGANTNILSTDGAGQTSWITKPAGSGDSLPVVDTTAVVKGSADATKLVRIEADGITTGTTRVITMPDADIDLTPGTGSFATEAEGALAATAMQDLSDDTTPTLGGDLALGGNNIDFPTTANISDCKDEDDMASDSATMLATQQSIKAYADAVAAPAFRGALVHNTADLTTQDYTSAATTVTFDAESYDTDSIHDTSTNTDRLTVPTGVTFVRLSGGFRLTAGSVNDITQLSIFKNASGDYIGLSQTRNYINSETNMLSVTSPILAVVATDYFTLVPFIAADSSVTVDDDRTWFSMEIIE